MTLFYDCMKTRYQMLGQFDNHNDEPFFDFYKKHLGELLELIQKTGEELEGNVFYGHHFKNPTPEKLDPVFKIKRQGLALFSMSKSRVLEIGFNSGFSSLLMLIANPNLKLVSVDAGYHRYSHECARYLEQQFHGRFRFIVGDSREVLPMLFQNDTEFDGYHIDGGHQESIAEADLCNIINNALTGSTICFDDADSIPLRRIISLYLLKGSVSHIYDPTHYLPSENQMFLRVN
jgi:hypothetical protein